MCGASRRTSSAGSPAAVELGPRLVLGLAAHQRFGLREEVGEQQLVVFGQPVMGQRGGQEVARHQPRALMNQLIEGVLAVGARLAPDDRAGGARPTALP